MGEKGGEGKGGEGGGIGNGERREIRVETYESKGESMRGETEMWGDWRWEGVREGEKGKIDR